MNYPIRGAISKLDRLRRELSLAEAKLERAVENNPDYAGVYRHDVTRIRRQLEHEERAALTAFQQQ